jgi:hypothetical protein
MVQLDRDWTTRKGENITRRKGQLAGFQGGPPLVVVDPTGGLEWPTVTTFVAAHSKSSPTIKFNDISSECRHVPIKHLPPLDPRKTPFPFTKDSTRGSLFPLSPLRSYFKVSPAFIWKLFHELTHFTNFFTFIEHFCNFQYIGCLGSTVSARTVTTLYRRWIKTPLY